NGRVLKEDYADAPSLIFLPTGLGATSSDSPKTVTLWNDGNAPLTFAIPASGNNPAITTNYTLTSGVAGDCPLVTHSSSTAGTLVADSNCLLPVNFKPTTTGVMTGSLTLTDNNLNVAGAKQ